MSRPGRAAVLDYEVFSVEIDSDIVVAYARSRPADLLATSNMVRLINMVRLNLSNAIAL